MTGPGKPGPTPLPPGEAREIMIRIRANAAEKARMEDAAANVDMSLSAYLRFLALGPDVEKVGSDRLATGGPLNFDNTQHHTKQ